MNAPDSQVATLFRESTTGLEPDVDLLVAGGIARGRTARRRRRAGTAMAAVAMGVVGVGLALAPGLGGDGSRDGVAVYDEPKPASPKQNTPKADVGLAIPAADVPATFEELLASDAAGPVLRVHPFPVVNEPDHRIAHFLWKGTLTTFIIERASTMASCAEQATRPATCAEVDGLEVLTYPPTTLDHVTTQSRSVWTHGYIVTAQSYNAVDGKDVPPLMDAPPITLEQLLEIARSDIWFS